MIVDYVSLQAAIANWLNRDDASDIIPDLIRMAEAAFPAGDPVTGKRLRVAQMVGRSTSTATTAYEALPDDYLDMIAVAAPAQTSVVGASLYFSPAPTPQAPISVSLTYYQKVPALSAANPTNWLLKGFPNAYLFGALLQSSSFYGDSGRDAAWLSQYRQAIAAVQASNGRKTTRPLMVDPALCRGEDRFYGAC